MLDYHSFLNVVANAPLVSVDLVLVRGGSEVLLGLRNNRPAQHFWFVPGGRILKNETIEQAKLRITQTELGNTLLDGKAQIKVSFHGVYEHFYQDCFAADAQVSTHYVVLAYKVELPADFTFGDSALPKKDDQHVAFKWWPIPQALAANDVHQFTKNYFIQQVNLIK